MRVDLPTPLIKLLEAIAGHLIHERPYPNGIKAVMGEGTITVTVDQVEHARAYLAALSVAAEPEPVACDVCRLPVEYDLLVIDELWAKIAPRPIDGWKGGGILCPACILERALTSKEAGAPEGWKAKAVFENPCIQKLEPGEPFFVLLGRDKHAALATRAWADFREMERGISSKTIEAREIADAMEIYARPPNGESREGGR